MPIRIAIGLRNIQYHFILLILFFIFSCTQDQKNSKSSINTEERRELAENVNLHTPENPQKELFQDKKNSPPQLTNISLMPEVFKPGDTLYIEAEAADPDDDEVTILYDWYLNGELVSTEKSLNLPIKRGDKLIIRIKPFDGKDYGKVIILEREISNIPPVIIDHKDFHFDKKTFTYQVKASDPDGDVLSYSIKSGPPGMAINPSTGLVKWDIPPEFKGNAQVMVSVTDDHGGETLYTFEVTIGLEKR